MTGSVFCHTLDNGLVLVAEQMDWLASAAFSIALPTGGSRDPEQLPGLGNFTCEMVQRGCGNRDSRQFVEDLERLGVESNATVSTAHTIFGGAMPAENLPAALAVYADLVQRPRLPTDEIDEARQVCIQELRAVEDDLAQKLMLELRRLHYPYPWNRPCQGTFEALDGISANEVAGHFAAHYAPGGAILSVAGKIDWPALLACVEEQYGDWPSRPKPSIHERHDQPRVAHLPLDSGQTHIGVAYRSVPYRHADYYQARGAVGVLSDGMSSRLFTEVREKRGLCYAVFASYYSLRDQGAVMCYAGTSTERAQETLDVMLAELQRLGEGIEPEELHRLKARIKSSLIMQQESSASRSSSIAADWYHLGRVQTMDEVGRIIDELSCESVNRYLAQCPPNDFTVVTLGAEPLEVPFAVS